MATSEGIRLELADLRAPLTALAEVNGALREVGARVWPLSLASAPAEIRPLLGQTTLTDGEAERVRTHFLLPRERLLQLLGEAGRKPHVPGGGEMSTLVSNEGYSYPQLWVVQGGQDYSRFDRFHVNVSDDGVGVDEVLQLLSGRGFVIRLRRSGGDAFTLRLDCPRADTGWLLTYDGGRPHIGSLTTATPGSKMLVQAIGPARWALEYVDSSR
jgi:hypothetical protein